MKSKGLTPLIGMAFVLIILSFLYISYQTYIIPKICENYEVKHFYKVQQEFVEFSKKVRTSISTGTNGEFYFSLGSTYPEIPFFTTLKGFSGTLVTYPAEIRIKNAIAVNDEIRDVWNGNEMIYEGVSLMYIPRTFYTQPSKILWEYGVVAVGKDKFFPIVPSKPIEGNTIFLPLLRGNLSYSGLSISGDLFVYSGGGGYIEVTDNGNPITILLRSNLPLDFWDELLSSEPNVASIGTENISGVSYIKIELVKGVNYKLILGAVSFEDEGHAPPHYLYRISQKIVTTPATLKVEVRDVYNNPTSNVDVTFTSTNGSTTLNSGQSSGTSVSVKSTELGIAGVVAESASGSDTVVASLTREDGSTYEVAFFVVG